MKLTFDWNDLRFFLAVARQGTLTGAAKRMATDHATVSRRISALEAALGAKLFERSPQGYVLTQHGERLLAYAEPMETQALGAIRDLGHSELGVSGTVRLNTLEGFGNFFLMQRMGRFAAQHPQLKIEIITIQQIMSLSKREGDVAISLHPPKEGRFFTKKLTDYRLLLYASKDYLASSPPIHSRQDLKRHIFIGYVDDLIFTRGLDYLDEVFVGAKARIQSSSILAQREITEGGHGLCVLPAFMTAGRKNLVPILPHEVAIVRSYWLFAHADVAEIARVRALTRFIEGEVAAAPDFFMPGI